MRRIDLHIHSNKSDGVLTPFEIIDEAVKNEVDTICISDHDTVEAYTDELVKYAEDNNIKLIRGVEVSTQDTVGVHVLGYNIDVNNKELNDMLYKLRNSRHIYLHDVAKALDEIGYKVNVEELDKIDSVTKAHISDDIVKNKDNEELLLKTFGHIPTKGEFIESIMNEGCPAYVKRASVSPKEAAEIIRKAGGKAVLAHPVAYKYEDNLKIEDIQKLVNEMNPDGIEAYYHYADRNDNRVDEVEKWKEFAKKNNKFVTIGSDFHKTDGIRPEIGFINWPIELTNSEIDSIINNII
jgi:predicted metal-dependent phosphoesterase TrpH